MEIDSLGEKLEELRLMMREHLGVRGRDFATALRRAGRLLPRHLQREGRALIEAGEMARSPRLMKMIDQQRTERAYREIRRFLESRDPMERRIDLALSILGGIALAVLAAGGLVLFFLIWRGYL